MGEIKKWWLSKTVWTNLLMAIAVIVNDVWGIELDAKTQGAIIVIVNLILRTVTTEPITW